MKKIIYTLVVFACSVNTEVFATWSKPVINCEWLPWCSADWTENAVEWVAATIIAQLIQYVAVVAVIALMISGVMYMLSSWEEEKTKKAKIWIIWSVVAVILSISAYYIVNTLNEINIT